MADADLENQVQLLAQQVAALQAQPAIPAPNPVVPFALTPARANQDVIDMSLSNGIKLYKAITTPLETKFDGSSGKLLAFLDDLDQKASRYGWTENLLSINDQDPVNPQDRNLLQHHRMLTIENVQAHATTYVGTQTRIAQDASMMYEFLRDSLTEGARARLATDSVKYTINGLRNGPCYLKTLLIKFYVETRATNFHLRQKLQRLPTTIAEMKFDIATFNDHVRELVQDLAAGGETSNDLIVYVFDAYLKVKDNSFMRYIERKKEAYDDGSENVTVEVLMDLALVKYNQLKQSNTWKSKTPEQEQIFALLAQLKQTQGNQSTKSTSDKTKNKGKDKKEDKTKGFRNTPNKGKINGNKKGNIPQWRYEQNGNETTMVKDGKTWCWCDFHGYWCEHVTKDCRAKKKADNLTADDKTVKRKNDGQTTTTTPALSIARALLAISDNETLSDTDL